MARTQQKPTKVPSRPSGGRPGVPGRPSARQSGTGSARPARPVARTSARRLAQQRRQRNIYVSFGAVAVVVVVIGAILAVKLLGGSGTPSTGPGDFALPAGVVSEVTGLPVKTLVAAAEADKRQNASPPQALPPHNSLLTLGGTPEILYMGAEYCPFCAAERWALVMALSKFGTFTNLQGTSSSSIDVNASTPTFSFYGSKYSSPYIHFVSVELQTNTYDSAIGNYPTLQKPTAQQQQIITKWDAPPYVPSGHNGAIPFVYLAGRYIITGIQYDASHIAGWTMTNAASYLTSGTNPTSRALEASAGYLVGDICALTHGQPARVCSVVPANLRGITTSSPANRGSSSTTPTTAKKFSKTKKS
jgi:thiol-disulfide isomerase/thioredoxin